jgi:hypothetical protein
MLGRQSVLESGVAPAEGTTILAVIKLVAPPAYLEPAVLLFRADGNWLASKESPHRSARGCEGIARHLEHRRVSGWFRGGLANWLAFGQVGDKLAIPVPLLDVWIRVVAKLGEPFAVVVIGELS